MQEAKSETASQQRMALLRPRGSAAASARPRADIELKVKTQQGFVPTTASGHLDEVQELAKGGTKMGSAEAAAAKLSLMEKQLLGEGAFSRVSEVLEESTNRTFALKRMTKTAALQCPEHVYCEQHISKNAANPFCIRQYASFKVCEGQARGRRVTA